MSPTRVHPFSSPTSVSHLDQAAAVWVAAAGWLCSIFFYALCSISWAWLCSFCMSQGLVVSGLSPPNQSRGVFLTGVLLWAQLFLCSSVVVMRAMALFPLHLLSHPSRPAGARRILSRMIQRTGVWFILCGFLISAIGMGIGGLDPAWRKLRLEIYLSSLVLYSYVAVADQAARRVYRRETVEGCAVPHLRRTSSRVGSVLQHVQSARRTLQVAINKLTVLLALLVPVWYVHGISSMAMVSSHRMVVTIILASLLFKVLVQEAAKRYILDRNIGSARSMAALVSIPTVIVDTQIRIVFLRFQTTMATVFSTLVLAVAELVLRFTKATLTRRRIERRRWSVAASEGLVVGQKSSPSIHDFELWKAQISRHSVMELSAGMFAEYSAIGGSYGILLFFGHHSQYSIGLAADSASLGGTSLSVLAFQVGVEVVVDYISCVVELHHGVDLAPFYRERGFLFVFFLATTLLNINVSSTLYLAT